MGVIDPSRCPLCRGDNACGVAEGAATCWCFSATVPAEVLERVPDESRGLACVCAGCASGTRGPAEAHVSHPPVQGPPGRV